MLILVAITTKFESREIPLPNSNSLQDFKQIEQKTSAISHFHFFTVLQDCICDVILRAWKKSVLFIDQEKAFDRISHSFLLKTLKQFNFGAAFKSWIETILTDIKSQVKANGYLTEEINITRGIRQGVQSVLYYMFT